MIAVLTLFFRATRPTNAQSMHELVGDDGKEVFARNSVHNDIDLAVFRPASVEKLRQVEGLGHFGVFIQDDLVRGKHSMEVKLTRFMHAAPFVRGTHSTVGEAGHVARGCFPIRALRLRECDVSR